MLHRIWPRCFACAMLAWNCVGCERVIAPTGLLEQTAPQAALSSQKLRTLLIDYVPRFAGQIEQSADRILAEATDPQIRHQALMWKAYAIPACFRAASRQDPLGAYLDVWVLTKQMTALLERPSAPPFGPWQAQALETSRRLEEPIRQIYASMGVPLSLGEDFVTQFAAAHPIENLYFDRASLANDYIQQIDIRPEELMQVAGALSEDLNELRKLTALYADFVPKQVRWQAELLMEGALARGPMAVALSDASLAARAADRLAGVAESVPVTLAHERQALQSIVAGERQQVLLDFDRMRLETLAAVRAEREVVLTTFHQERVATSEALGLASQDALASAEGLIERRTEQAIDSAHGLLERGFNRAMQFAVVLIAGVATLICLSKWLPRWLDKSSGDGDSSAIDFRAVRQPEERPPRAAA